MDQYKTGNILSFDFGEKRIGVAIGNITTQISHPLHTIETEKNSERFKIIEGLLNDWKPDKAVVGLPLNDDGSESKLTQLAKKFTNKIKNKYNLEVINVDERYSSKEAKQRIIEDGLSRKDKGRIDQISAMIILESYFEQKK